MSDCGTGNWAHSNLLCGYLLWCRSCDRIPFCLKWPIKIKSDYKSPDGTCVWHLRPVSHLDWSVGFQEQAFQRTEKSMFSIIKEHRMKMQFISFHGVPEKEKKFTEWNNQVKWFLLSLWALKWPQAINSTHCWNKTGPIHPHIGLSELICYQWRISFL